MGESELLHIDESVSKALVELNQSIKQFSGRFSKWYTVLFIPHVPDEKIVMSVNGVILDKDNKTPPEQILALAMKERHKGQVARPRFGHWHIDSEVERTIIRLNDEVCSFERATEREYTILLIPHDSLEQLMMSQSGKPLPPDFDMEPEEILSMAMNKRRGG